MKESAKTTDPAILSVYGAPLLHNLTTLGLPPNAALRREPRGDAP
jgi:hypothetical protein